VTNIDPSGAYYLDEGVKLCYYVCILGGYQSDNESGDHPYLGFGLGNPSASGGLTVSTGQVEQGWSGEFGCSYGFVGASVDTSGNLSGGLGTEASTGECDLSAKYTFGSL
jgi:hypothetical protein